MDRRTVAGTFCAAVLGGGITALVTWAAMPADAVHNALAWFGVAGFALGGGGLGYLLISGPKPAPRHRDGIYQFGERVGGVGGAFERIEEGFIDFDFIAATQDFDREVSFEYRTFVLEVVKYRYFNRSPNGGGGRYVEATCKILKG